MAESDGIGLSGYREAVFLVHRSVYLDGLMGHEYTAHISLCNPQAVLAGITPDWLLYRHHIVHICRRYGQTWTPISHLPLQLVPVMTAGSETRFAGRWLRLGVTHDLQHGAAVSLRAPN